MHSGHALWERTRSILSGHDLSVCSQPTKSPSKAPECHELASEFWPSPLNNGDTNMLSECTRRLFVREFQHRVPRESARFVPGVRACAKSTCSMSTAGLVRRVALTGTNKAINNRVPPPFRQARPPQSPLSQSADPSEVAEETLPALPKRNRRLKLRAEGRHFCEKWPPHDSASAGTDLDEYWPHRHSAPNGSSCANFKLPRLLGSTYENSRSAHNYLPVL